jgi:hypothetical protein
MAMGDGQILKADPSTGEFAQHAGTPQRGSQAAPLCSANFPQCRELLESDAALTLSVMKYGSNWHLL